MQELKTFPELEYIRPNFETAKSSMKRLRKKYRKRKALRT